MAAKPPPPTEAAEGAVVSAWLKIHRVLFCHVPNEGKRSIATARFLQAQGMVRGVPDYLIFTTPPNAPSVRGVAIELKRCIFKYRKGGGLTEHQVGFLEDLNDKSCDWLAKVCYGADEAITFLEELGYGNRPVQDA